MASEVKVEGGYFYYEVQVDGRKATLEMSGGTWVQYSGHGQGKGYTFVAQGRVPAAEAIRRVLVSLGMD